MGTVTLALILIGVCFSPVHAQLNEPNFGEYLQRIYDSEPMAKRAVLPYSGGIYGKRAAVLPYSGGIYGKRGSVPFSGGIYGKRSDSEVDDVLAHVNGISIRAMPINGGFYG